jgi:hypothetical protein
MKPDTAHVKGTDIITIKNMLIQKSPQAYTECLEKLTDQAQNALKQVMAADWISNAHATAIMEEAAKILFPGRADDLEQLGRGCAEKAFTGIYRAFLRITSLPFLLKNVPQVWHQYHSVGKAEIMLFKDKGGGTLTVTGASDVSISNLRLVTGFSMRALEMAGAKNLSCKLRVDNPAAWQWTFTWMT